MEQDVPRFRLFHEPLVSTCDTSLDEDCALRKQIVKFSDEPSINGIGHLLSFLAVYPSSGWRLAILINVGLIYFHDGYFSLALSTFRETWLLALAVSEHRAKALADRAIGELIRMAARLGSTDELSLLLAEISDRNFTGPATQCIAGAREGLWTMINNPGQAFLCGPLALGNILASESRRKNIRESAIVSYRSRPGGISIGELEALSQKCGLSFRAVHWTSDSPYPVPSVVHLKLNHYAAIVAQEEDRYLIQDPTFGGQDLWVTAVALRSESTGYLLVPTETNTAHGARSLLPVELLSIRGMGFTSSSDPNATSPEDDKQRPCDDGRGMCRHNIHSMLVSLNIVDTPVGYIPPRGPTAFFTLTYNHREANQPAIPDFSNYGPKWTSNWLHYITDDPEFAGNRVSRQVAGGGTRVYSGYNQSTGTFTREAMDGSLLVRTTDSSVTYTRTLRNGTREIFAKGDGSEKYPRRTFLSKLIDRHGNSVTLVYDAFMRLTSFIDATGRSTHLYYGDPIWPLQVTQVTDPIGRSAKLFYDPSGRLVRITDVVGLTSNFTYATDDFISALTTHYGTTIFEVSEGGTKRTLKITDPMGLVEKAEYCHEAPEIPNRESTSPKGLPGKFNEYINARNTFYWNKYANQVAPDNYAAARLKHWLHLRSNTAMTAGTLESVKAPLEGRIWFGYLGSNYGKGGIYDEPTYIGRVLDDGSTQLSIHVYNSTGNLALFTDSAGRQTSFVYAKNGIDVTKVHQKTAAGSVSTIAKYSYDSNHNILTYEDSARHSWTFTYSSTSELITSLDPAGALTTYAYDLDGNLLQVTDDSGRAILSLTYDAFGRVRTQEDSEGYLLVFDYDAMDRIISVQFPDGTSNNLLWSGLDLIEASDRHGRKTQYFYDLNRRLVKIVDESGRPLQFSYDGEYLASITDQDNRTTVWKRDVQGRVISKHYPDGSTFQVSYEPICGRLREVISPLAQSKRFSYTVDGRIASINYLNGDVSTPNVLYKYGKYFPRVEEMTDGTGTTTYQYHKVGSLGALALSKEIGPFGLKAAISFVYDRLGRVIGRQIGEVVEEYSYDANGRLIQHNSPLGEVNIGHLGETGEIALRRLEDSHAIQYEFGNATIDRRLTKIGSSSWGSSYKYNASADDVITSISLQHSEGAMPDVVWHYTRDGARRLVSANRGVADSISFSYDISNNRLTEEDATAIQTAEFNALNQIVSCNGVPFSYDLNGNLIADGRHRFEWDAEDRLVHVHVSAIEPGGAHSEVSFQYDGIGRLAGATFTGTDGLTYRRKYVWSGENLCQVWDEVDRILRIYVADGEVRPQDGERLFYVRDNVGSVILMHDISTGRVVYSAEYLPFGKKVTEISERLPDFQFGGMLYEPLSGLHLARHRPYDSCTGRWISRDPVGEQSGVNSYAYCDNDPITFTDPDGLVNWISFGDTLADYSSGFGDTLSFGATSHIRKEWDVDDGINKCGKAYAAGMYTELAGELAFSLASLGLRAAARGVSQSAARRGQLIRGTKGVSAAHHIHPLKQGLFPTASLPRFIRHSRFNLKLLSLANHKVAHSELARHTKYLEYVFNPATISLRQASAVEPKDCSCE